MTVKELKEALNCYPDDMEVWFDDITYCTPSPALSIETREVENDEGSIGGRYPLQ